MPLLETDWISKETSSKQMVRYQSRIIHQVDPIQRELKNALQILSDTTSDFVDYLPLGKLGVTLTVLDPVLKSVIGADKRGEISDSLRKDFESELNKNFSQWRHSTVEVEDNEFPFELFGSSNDRLGITLAEDTQLFGERVLTERYIRDQYPVKTKRFGENIVSWKPHVTIGTIRKEVLGSDFVELQSDTSGFIFDAVSRAQTDIKDRFNLGSNQLVLPEELSLGGLRVVCDRQGQRLF